MNGRCIALTSLCTVLLAAADAPRSRDAEPDASDSPEQKQHRRHRRKKLPPVPLDAFSRDPAGAAAAAAATPAVPAPPPAPTGVAAPSGAASVSAATAPAPAPGAPTVRVIPAPGAMAPAPPPPVGPVPPAGAPYDVRYAAPGAAPSPFMPTAAASPSSPQQSGRTMLIAGLGTFGGSYLLSLGLSSFSYAGYYRGQWGWLIPMVGPIVAMAGADGGFSDCAGGCMSKSLFTYFTGLINLGTYLSGLGLIIAGGVQMRKGGQAPLVASRPPVQVVPFSPASGTGSGLMVIGRF